VTRAFALRRAESRLEALRGARWFAAGSGLKGVNSGFIFFERMWSSIKDHRAQATIPPKPRVPAGPEALWDSHTSSVAMLIDTMLPVLGTMAFELGAAYANDRQSRTSSDPCDRRRLSGAPDELTDPGLGPILAE